jgi:hypothetical protein
VTCRGPSLCSGIIGTESHVWWYSRVDRATGATERVPGAESSFGSAFGPDSDGRWGGSALVGVRGETSGPSSPASQMDWLTASPSPELAVCTLNSRVVGVVSCGGRSWGVDDVPALLVRDKDALIGRPPSTVSTDGVRDCVEGDLRTGLARFTGLRGLVTSMSRSSCTLGAHAGRYVLMVSGTFIPRSDVAEIAGEELRAEMEILDEVMI